MPLIEIKVFEDELNQMQTHDLVNKITDAVTDVTSEKLRNMTWITISEIKSGHWGVGGKTLGLDDVKNLIASD
ncbi:MAG: tautomerase family protein [Gammaproteobacteria bacterium]|nr:tautomerase family protein [Gammaproteobacteria bacterium]